jgi:hypothetical protein
MSSKDKVSKYLNDTYGGKELLKKHKLSDHGIWQVFGEDPNCDFGGFHHSPQLGFYEGKLSDVLATAVELPHFYTWGGGGKLELVKPKTVVAPEVLSKKIAEYQSIKDALAQAKAGLEAIGVKVES